MSFELLFPCLTGRAPLSLDHLHKIFDEATAQNPPMEAGLMNPASLSRVSQELGLEQQGPQGLDEVEAANIMLAHDKDDDGFVCFSEFVMICVELLNEKGPGGSGGSAATAMATAGSGGTSSSSSAMSPTAIAKDESHAGAVSAEEKAAPSIGTSL